jgi:hypothetical protein
MKRIFLSLSLMLTVGLTAVLANDETPVSSQVQESFKKEFAGAQFVKWSGVEEYLKATFVLGGHMAEAYFNANGELQGCVRDLFYDQLPLAVMKSLDKRFAEADILEVREITNTAGTTYRVTLEMSDKKYRVKTDAEGNIIEEEKVKK